MSDLTDLSGVGLGLVNTTSDVEEFMRWLGERRDVLAFDTETTGLDPWEPGFRIRTAQFGDAMTGWSIRWDLWLGLIQEVFRTYRGRLVLHNQAYDTKVLLATAPDIVIPWGQLDDTMTMARIDDPSRSAALKPLAARLIDKNAARAQEVLNDAMTKNGWNFATVPFEYEPYFIYGAMDTVLTARLWSLFTHVRTGPITRDVYELEQQVRKACTVMEVNGARVDVEYCAEKYKQLDEYVDATAKWAKDAYGISIGSPSQLAKWFIEHGYPITKRTASGAPSMDKESLDAILAEHPDCQLADLALKARRADKLAATYFLNFLNRHREGLLHPDINTLQARTGRMSISNPALQTLPKRDKIVRHAFVPRNSGEVILTSDADQIELRLFAAISKDIGLKMLFKQADSTGPDVFTQLAQQIYDDPTIVKADPRRDTIKTYIYSSLYGASVAKQAVSAGVPYAVMRRVADDFGAAYPNVKKFQEQAARLAVTTGEVTTASGRVLKIDSSRPHAAVNYIIQGTAAEVLKTAIVSMDNAGLGEFMVCPVHDEIVLSVPEDLVEDVSRTVVECMYVPEDVYGVQLTADISEPMSRWGTPKYPEAV